MWYQLSLCSDIMLNMRHGSLSFSSIVQLLVMRLRCLTLNILRETNPILTTYAFHAVHAMLNNGLYSCLFQEQRLTISKYNTPYTWVPNMHLRSKDTKILPEFKTHLWRRSMRWSWSGSGPILVPWQILTNLVATLCHFYS